VLRGPSPAARLRLRFGPIRSRVTSAITAPTVASFQSGSGQFDIAEEEGRDEQPEAGDDSATVRLSDRPQGLL